MVFGLSEKQKRILMYLYDLRNSPESPPDPRLQISSIADSLEMKKWEVRKEIQKLCNGTFVKDYTFERKRYCKIMPRGIREIEKATEKESEWNIGTDGIGYRRKKRENL